MWVLLDWVPWPPLLRDTLPVHWWLSSCVGPATLPNHVRRDHSCDIRIVNKEISRKHAEVYVEDSGAVRERAAPRPPRLLVAKGARV